MKFFLIIATIFSTVSFAQSNSKWEYCANGLDGDMTLNISRLENTLYESTHCLFSDDSGATWQAHKFPTKIWSTGEVYDINYRFAGTVVKFQGAYLALSFSGYSYDKKNWHKLNYSGDSLPKFSILKNFTTDSTLIIQIKNNSDDIYETFIARNKINPDSNKLYISKSETALPPEDKVIEFSIIDDILHATTTSVLSVGKYYTSTDGGNNWKPDSIPAIESRITGITKIKSNYFILTEKNEIWKKNTDGSWFKLENEFLPETERDILVAYKDKILTVSMIDGMSILVSSSDEGQTWERFGNSDFHVKQLLVIGNKLIANTLYGVLVSDDAGTTWKNSNRGIFYSMFNLKHNQYMEIIKNGNVAITSPRNLGIKNAIMKSYDGGKTWERKIVDTENLNDNITVCECKWGIFAKPMKSLAAYKTNDFGETWQKYSDVAAVFCQPEGLYERNDTLFFYSQNYLSYSLDMGKSLQGLDFDYYKNLPQHSHHFALIDGIHYAISSKSELYKSVNDGRNWEYLRDLGDYSFDVKDITCIDGTTIYIKLSDNKGIIYRIEDFGKNIEEIELPLSFPPQVWLARDGVQFIAYFTSRLNEIYSSEDQGESWKLLNEEISGHEITDIFLSGEYLIASTKVGLYRYYIGPSNIEVKEQHKPITFYPMPARNVVFMKHNDYNLTGVKVYDMMGLDYEIKDFTNDYFDVSTLPSGFYIAKLIFDDRWSITKKFIKY
jgi:photosystem II stability/assembly factor-like uncharacterized protein